MYVNYREFEESIEALNQRLETFERQHRNALRVILTNVETLTGPDDFRTTLRNLDAQYGPEAAIRRVVDELGLEYEDAETIYDRLCTRPAND